MVSLDQLLRKARTWREERLIARSRLFDAQWYVQRYPDVAAAGVDPLRHYVDCGFSEGRFPNQIFDSKWYADRYLAGRPQNPLVDYLRRGRRKGHRPNPWFDPAWYRRHHGVSSGDPMLHYLSSAARDDLATCAAFPVPDYATRYPDLGKHGTRLGSFLHDYRIFGGVDYCTSYYVAGWSRRWQGPEMVVTILVNGQPVGEAKPWIERPDVEKAKGFKALGFFFKFPTRLHHDDLVEFADEFGDRLIGCAIRYEIPPLGFSSEHYPSRAAIAAAFLTGCGLEIGAFTQPTDLPPDRDILFFDRFATEDLRRFYAPDCPRPMMEPTYVGEAESLDGVPEAAFDFIIANHVIEHLLDPILFLKNVTARLVVGGRAMIAAPDKRFCFDAPRMITPFAHLVEDHARGGATSQVAHFAEYAETIGQHGDAALAFARTVDPATIHFHYHVWDAPTFVAFIEAAITFYEMPLKLLYTQSTTHDVIVVLEKTADNTFKTDQGPE